MIRYFRNTTNGLVYKEEDGKLYFYANNALLLMKPALKHSRWWTSSISMGMSLKPISEEEAALEILEN